MRNLLLIVLGLASVILLFIQCRTPKIESPIIDPEPPDPGMKIVYLQYARYGMRSNVEKKYEMIWEEEERRYKLTYEDYKGEIKTSYTDFSFGVEIGEILREGKVDKYKDYYDPGRSVLDGWTWHFEVKYAGGKSVRSGGRIRKPSDFSGVERTEAKIRQAMGL